MARSKNEVGTSKSKAAPTIKVSPANAAQNVAATQPKAGAPTPPHGFEPPTKDQVAHFLKPTESQVTNVAEALAEVKQSVSYKDDFSKRAPSQDVLVGQLEAAAEWSHELARAEAWKDYVLAQKEITWDALLQTLKKLQPEFELAVKHEPELTATYKHLASVLGARKEVAAKAAETKTKNKAEAKKNGPTK